MPSLGCARAATIQTPERRKVHALLGQLDALM